MVRILDKKQEVCIKTIKTTTVTVATTEEENICKRKEVNENGIVWVYDLHTLSDLAFDLKINDIVTDENKINVLLEKKKSDLTAGGKKGSERAVTSSVGGTPAVGKKGVEGGGEGKVALTSSEKVTSALAPAVTSGKPTSTRTPGVSAAAVANTQWLQVDKIFAHAETQTFKALLYAAIDVRLRIVAAEFLEEYFSHKNALSQKDAYILVARNLNTNFQVAVKQQAAWDALSIAPRASAADIERQNFSEESAASSLQRIFRNFQELSYARAWARYGYSARDISTCVRQGVEDFIYSTLNAAPKHLECAPFCSEVSVDDKGARVKRCATKECANTFFDVFEDAQQIVRFKEYLCGPLFGGSLRDRTCGTSLQELSALFSSFLAMYKNNANDNIRAALNKLTRNLEDELERLSLKHNAHSVAPVISRAATLQST